MPTNDPSHEATAESTARFTREELAYLLDVRRIGRLATTDATATPHVVPVGWSYNRDLGTIDVSGRNFAATRKYRNVQANPRAAFVVDDVLPPFRPRCVMVQGTAQALDASRSGGTEAMIRIIPNKITSWGLDDSPPSGSPATVTDNPLAKEHPVTSRNSSTTPTGRSPAAPAPSPQT